VINPIQIRHSKNNAQGAGLIPLLKEFQNPDFGISAFSTPIDNEVTSNAQHHN
jgi:hypothetical protein